MYIPILQFTLLSYSKSVSQYLEKNSFSLYSKHEFQFIEEVFILIERLFGYKPPLTVGNFFTFGNSTCTQNYVSEKLQLCIEVIGMVRNKHSMIGKRSSSVKENINQDSQSPRETTRKS